MEAASLKVNEASLTGESLPVGKSLDPIEEEVPLGDRRNLGFMGTVVEAGRGKGVIVATGMDTELGKIAGLVQEEPRGETPLQRQLARFARHLSLAILAVVAFIFAIGYLRQPEELFLHFLTAVALAVAAIPEALPAVVTIGLALGLRRMARRNALIRRLPAVEALGSASVICTDKTGTLTTGKMNVRVAVTPEAEYEVEGEGFHPEGEYRRDAEPVDPVEDEVLRRLLLAGLLCNDARLVERDDRWEIDGDSTEGAILVAAIRAGLSRDREEGENPRVAEIPFSSERKRMTTIHAPLGESQQGPPQEQGDGAWTALLQGAEEVTAWMKGAPEVVVARCTRLLRRDGAAPLTESDREAFLNRATELAEQAYRVLAMAYRPLPPNLPSLEAVEEDLICLGMVGIMDAPRREAIEAVEQCRAAGIQVVMVTGDHKVTALAIAREMGIYREDDLVLTGSEMRRLTAGELAKRVERVKVYARLSPEQKVKILDAWKQRGFNVAMTGDGVNDAPALKRADIGVAMGITGTDVAKEAADMVLTDDNFASIVEAVEEGRGVYENIRKFIRYLLSTNSGEVLVLLVASALFLPLPLLPLQILWINLITDGFPALALGVEPKERHLMRRPPRDPREGILAGGIAFHIVWVGLLMTVGTLSLFLWGLGQQGIDYARSLAFYTIAMFQVFHVLAIRVSRDSVFTAGFFRNPYLIGAVFLTALLQLAVIYAPFLQVAFETLPLALDHLLLATGVAATVFVAVEAEKGFRRRRGGESLTTGELPSVEG